MGVLQACGGGRGIAKILVAQLGLVFLCVFSVRSAGESSALYNNTHHDDDDDDKDNNKTTTQQVQVQVTTTKVTTAIVGLFFSCLSPKI